MGDLRLGLVLVETYLDSASESNSVAIPAPLIDADADPSSTALATAIPVDETAGGRFEWLHTSVRA